MAQLTNGQTVWKIIGLAENLPLFFMVGVGCSFSVYTAYRSSTTSTDMVWNTTRRNLLAENMEHPAHILNEEKKYHRGWLRELASVRSYSHILPDVGVPKGEHAHS